MRFTEIFEKQCNMSGVCMCVKHAEYYNFLNLSTTTLDFPWKRMHSPECWRVCASWLQNIVFYSFKCLISIRYSQIVFLLFFSICSLYYSPASACLCSNWFLLSSLGLFTFLHNYSVLHNKLSVYTPRYVFILDYINIWMLLARTK